MNVGKVVVQGVVLLGLCTAAAWGAEDAWVEDFNDAKAWKSIWANEPAEFRADTGTLILASPKEGNGNVACAVAATTPVVDLSRYRYIVARIVEIGGDGDGLHQFRISLNRMEGGNHVDRADGIVSVYSLGFTDPALIVIDLHDSRVRWRCGKAALEIEIEAILPQTRIGVDYVKLTDSLSPKEEAGWETTKSRILGPVPTPFHGLDEFAARRGWIHAPYHLAGEPEKNAGTPDSRVPSTPPYFEGGKRYLSERLVYRDSVTGAPVWLLTRYPYMEQKYYMQHMHWNADGSILRWQSQRGGDAMWFMDATGVNLRSWTTGIPGFSEDTMGKNGLQDAQRSFTWAQDDPNAFFFASTKDGNVTVYRVNVRTGEKTVASTFKGDTVWDFRVAPDGKHFMVIKTQNNTKDDATGTIYIAGPEGLMHEIHCEHNIQDKTLFTGAADLSLFVVVTRPRVKRGAWLMSLDGKSRVHLPGGGGHGDWTGTAKWLAGFDTGRIFAVSLDGKRNVPLVNVQTGFHMGCSLDDRSILADVGHNGPWSDSLLFIDIDTRSAHRICTPASSYTGHGPEHRYHPYIHSNHPHPSLSPDATKGLFQSDFLTTYSQVFMSVNHLPDAPRAPSVKGRTLNWTPGERHREMKGYFVYRAEQSGGPYELQNAEPLKESQCALKGADGFYVVTAVEASGLESLPSPEVCAAAQWPGRVRLLMEAEQRAGSGPVRPWLDGWGAVGMYAAGLREEEKTGAFLVRTEVPRDGSYRVLARSKGEGTLAAGRGAAVTIAGKDAGVWQWRELGKVALEKGEREFEVRLTGQTWVDQILLTDEGGFMPDGPVRLDATAPAGAAGLQAVALDPFTVRLDWQPSGSADVAYYNVYCGADVGFAPSQARLIGSPAELALVDWGLKDGTTYHYKVTAVDRAGNESAPVSVQATTGNAKLVRNVVEAESGQISGGARVVDTPQAENGKAVRFPDGDEAGRLILSFKVPVDGEYAIWAHGYAHDGAADPLDYTLDQQKTCRWKLRVATRNWGWDFIGGDAQKGQINANPQLYQLKKGSHSITISSKNGYGIDRIVVTNDPTWEKAGFESLRGGH